MSETATIESPFGAASFGGDSVARSTDDSMGQMVPFGGKETDRAQSQIVTAQRVAVKRNTNAILQECRTIAAAMGDKMFYSWETRNRDGSKGLVQGPSIKCAMALVNIYGNCSIEAFPAQFNGDTIVFMARFVDFEKGVTVVRTFQQRMKQNIGMRDAERQADIIYQIGQSKAMRNAVNAALGIYCEEMVGAAKQGLLKRISANPDGARKWLSDQAAEAHIPIINLERVVARKAAAWTVPDMARLYGLMNSVLDGQLNAEDAFPAPGADEKVDEDGVVTGGKQAAPKKEPAKKSPPKAEPAKDTLADDAAAVREMAGAEPQQKASDPPPPAEGDSLEFE